MFDLYDTILKDLSFDFEKGLDYLYDVIFHEYCTKDELFAYANSLIPMFRNRIKTYEEFSFIGKELPLIFDKFNVLSNISFDELDYQFMLQTQKVTLLDEVKDYLIYLNKNNIKMYILSNTIFSTKSTKRLLEDFDILHFFNDVYCSSDYGYRKPSIKLYEYGINNILEDNPNCNRKDIVYIGNDYNTDVKGGLNAGLDVIWYNISNHENSEKLPIKNIQSIHELMNGSTRKGVLDGYKKE